MLVSSRESLKILKTEFSSHHDHLGHLQREHSLQEADDTAYVDSLCFFVLFSLFWLFVYVTEK